MEKETEKIILTNHGSYTWPIYPTFPNQNDHINSTSISYINYMPSISGIEVKDKVLFYYIKDNSIYYAIYEKGKPVVFTSTYDLSDVFKIIGAL